jgi:hypothetical protein
VTSLIEESNRKGEQSLPEPLMRRLKLLFVLSCFLGIAAAAGWTGFAYKTSSSSRVSEQMASLVTERDAMKAQRDEALHQLKQLQRPPQDLAQIDARLNALGTEYNRLWELAKLKRSQAVKEVDSTATGTIRKAPSPKQAH